MDGPQATFVEIVGRVCLRPRMYTLTGSFDEVMAFIGGADYAIRSLHSHVQDPTGTNGFGSWLAKRYADRCGGMYNLVWSAYIRAASTDEPAAIQQIPLLLTEYLEHHRGR